MDSQHLPSDPLAQQAVHEYLQVLQKYPNISPEFLTQQGLQMQSSTSLPAPTYPSQSQSMSSSDMNRRHSTAVDSSAAMQGRVRSSSRQYQTQPNPHFNNWHSETEALSNARKQPRHIPGPLLDIQEYFSQNGTEIDVPSHSPSFSEQQYDSAWLSPTHQSSHYSFNSSPTDTSPINTPSTAFTSTHSPTNMSRECSIASNLSLGHSLQNGFDMLRVNSNASHFSHSRSQSSAVLSAPSLHSARSRSNSHAQIPSPPTSHDLHSPQFTSSHQFVSSSLPSFDDYATSMVRSDSSSSNSSTSSHQSRVSRRSHEISQQAQRDLAPKGSDTGDFVKMKRVKSGDGSYKNKAEIPREAPNYKRPQHPKLYCTYCEDHPDGFRGDHELQRHVSRAHPMGTRKVWICIDASKDGKPFLQNCKACRTQKKYGAYYNAAAHLRRAHFNPRKRGRKAKSDAEKRGGKGGGSWPPMEDLKEHWIREVEEVVTADMKPLSKDDEEADQLDNDDDFNNLDANVTSYIGGAFDNNSTIATPQVSFDFVLDNSHSNTVDTIDPVNFNTSPFASALDMPSFNSYDPVSQATGMSDFAAQQFGDHNMYQQTFDDNNFAQHLASQEPVQYLSSQMW